MKLSDKSVQEFKQIFEKEYGKKLSDSEARESAERFMGFMSILYDQAVIEAKRNKRLDKEPKGFALESHEGPYNCLVCHRSFKGNEMWWDKFGLKCFDCQRNIDNKIIPGEIVKNDKLVIHDWQLPSILGVHPATVRKLRREGRIKGIDLKTTEGITYHTVYLVKENKEFIEKYSKNKGI